MDEAKKVFKPEFLNRLTEIVIFLPTAQATNGVHSRFRIGKFERLKERKLNLKVSRKLKDFLIDHGYDNKLGCPTFTPGS